MPIGTRILIRKPRKKLGVFDAHRTDPQDIGLGGCTTPQARRLNQRMGWVVGATRFERATSSSQNWRSTKLSYAPAQSVVSRRARGFNTFQVGNLRRGPHHR